MSQELSAPAAAAAGAAAGVTAAIQTVKEYTDLILKPPLTELGGIAGDTIAAWRFRNQVKNVLKTKKFLEERGIKPKKIIPSVAVPLLEAAADADDENLSDMFAELLTAHLDPSRQNEVHPSFAKVMAQLSPLDAKVLQLVDDLAREQWEQIRYAKGINANTFGVRWHKFAPRAEKELPEATMSQLELSLENLQRLGLCNVTEYTLEAWHMPAFGHRFLLVCNGPSYWRRQLRDAMAALEPEGMQRR